MNAPYVKVIVACLVLLYDTLPLLGDQQGPYTFTITNGVATITGFDVSYAGGLQITNTLGGVPVTAIGDGAFNSCNRLTSLSVPDSVTNIGDLAFAYCTGLTNVFLGAGVCRIGFGVFEACEKLMSVLVSPTNAAFCSVGGVLFDKQQTSLLRYPAGRSLSLIHI
ncbi:MAG: leucine-rich repeat domain-containing protein, partial [Kiritimatiellae bacterium]|nr:leucine-rich repeat domain-containing protein [Kiritimatiellia bacterium]